MKVIGAPGPPWWCPRPKQRSSVFFVLTVAIFLLLLSCMIFGDQRKLLQIQSNYNLQTTTETSDDAYEDTNKPKMNAQKQQLLRQQRINSHCR